MFKIQFKILLTVMFLIIIIIGATTTILITRETKTLTNEMKKRGVFIARSLSKSGAEHISSGNFSNLKYLIREIMDDFKDDIAFILILDTEGKTMVANEEFRSLENYQFNEVNEIYKKYKSKEYKYEPYRIQKEIIEISYANIKDMGIKFNGKDIKVLDFVFPIYFYEKMVGYTKLGLSLKPLNDAIFNKTLTASAIGFFSLILGAVFAIVISIFITKPIEFLVYGSNQLAKHNFKHKVNIKTNDEFQNLAETFNQMSEEIKIYSEDLERLVQERTEELSIANKELLLKNDKIHNELAMAQKIQEAIIPKELPSSRSINLCGIYVPMEDLGGDYYDVFNIDDRYIALVIADVCGHGVPAALITTMAKVSFKNNSSVNREPGEVVKLVNEELVNIIGEKEYLTAFYCIVDTKDWSLSYTNAGHNNMYLFRENGETLELKVNSGIIGFVSYLNFSTETIKLKPNDRIALYTDGIPEAKNDKEELYGYDRLKEIIINNRALPPKELVLLIINDVNRYKGDLKSDDDMTLLIADITPNEDVIKLDLEVLTERKKTRV